MTDPLILAIDNGTQSVRALLFDLQGNLVAKSQVPIEPYFSKQPGWAEQHPEYFWEKLCEACQSLWAECGAAREAVVGVGLTTQRATVINLDADGKPLRPAFVWLDQRRAEQVPKINVLWRAAFRALGVSETIAKFQSSAQANWIAENQPDIDERTDKLLFLSGYFTWRITGKFVDSVGAQVGYVPFDYKKRDWAASHDWKWQALSAQRSWFPDLVQPGSLLGHVTAEAAEATGIPAGLPMIACAADKACEVLGAGCVTPDVGCLSYGTTATLNTTSTKYFEPQAFVPPYPAAVPGKYSAEVQIYRGYWMVSWFKEQFGLREELLAEQQGVAPEVLFDELVNAVPPGSMGLMLQPYWSPGVREPGPEAKGSIIGFGDVHTRAHMYRAMLEGLAYALRQGKEGSEKRSKVPITSIRVSGGGSQSDAAMQLTADIFGLPTARPHLYETSGLGAAIDVAVGLGLHADFDKAVAAMTRLGDVFQPNPAAQKIYDDLYKRVYLRMYAQLKPLYEDIREITGYPA